MVFTLHDTTEYIDHIPFWREVKEREATVCETLNRQKRFRQHPKAFDYIMQTACSDYRQHTYCHKTHKTEKVLSRKEEKPRDLHGDAFLRSWFIVKQWFLVAKAPNRWNRWPLLPLYQLPEIRRCYQIVLHLYYVTVILKCNVTKKFGWKLLSLGVLCISSHKSRFSTVPCLWQTISFHFV